ncbi:Putative GMC-type oxidoreductase R135 [Frankliniella fusca]|uniref:GMC-type oxidoreductase R135 n=1 Tax=Frankliniella fusca TaxID=407009 RepID=A0AAE1HMI8_9NEOP|nr:Putative GMC-type oxidoreductase R135 [Frankliniella fusca]
MFSDNFQSKLIPRDVRFGARRPSQAGSRWLAFEGQNALVPILNKCCSREKCPHMLAVMLTRYVFSEVTPGSMAAGPSYADQDTQDPDSGLWGEETLSDHENAYGGESIPAWAKDTQPAPASPITIQGISELTEAINLLTATLQSLDFNRAPPASLDTSGLDEYLARFSSIIDTMSKLGKALKLYF